MYVHGVLNIQQRARAEALYQATCHEVHQRLSENMRQHRQILEELNEKLADKVFCNFSLFQSLPDIWAINQVFPIMPLHRLLEEPGRRAVLHDITCDSDGRIDYYVDSEGVESSLPLHHWQPGERYLLGFFLVGAYQEILGDMHNLFGDTDSVNVVCSAEGYRLTQAQQGDTVDSVLRYVNFEPRRLMEQYRHKVGSASLNPQQQHDYLAELEAGLSGYTYLEE
jgi:arginine decarboxylase